MKSMFRPVNHSTASDASVPVFIVLDVAKVSAGGLPMFPAPPVAHVSPIHSTLPTVALPFCAHRLVLGRGIDAASPVIKLRNAAHVADPAVGPERTVFAEALETPVPPWPHGKRP